MTTLRNFSLALQFSLFPTISFPPLPNYLARQLFHRSWIVLPQNVGLVILHGPIDNIFQAMLMLFEMMTTSGWMEMLQSMVDSTSVGVMQFPNANPFLAFYGVAHVFVGNWVLLNLVVGTVLCT